MKSIKEKTEELSTNFRKEQGDVGYSEQLSYKLGVEAGANYVLDEVECILEDNKFLDCEEICNKLIALIEQLKK